MPRPPIKQLKKSEELNKNVVGEFMYGSAPTQKKKKKYIVNIMFDSDWEQGIRRRAKEKGMTVAGYIKFLVGEDLNK